MNSTKKNFETLRSKYEKNLDQSLLNKNPMQRSLLPPLPGQSFGQQNHQQFNMSQALAQRIENFQASGTFNMSQHTLTTEGSAESIGPDGTRSRSRKKKSVSFKVYNVSNLTGIKSMREQKVKDLDEFSKERERSLSNSKKYARHVPDIMIVDEEQYSVGSSINQRLIQKENLKDSQQYLSNHSSMRNSKQNPFSVADIIHPLSEKNAYTSRDLSNERLSGERISQGSINPQNQALNMTLQRSGLSQVLKGMLDLNPADRRSYQSGKSGKSSQSPHRSDKSPKFNTLKLMEVYSSDGDKLTTYNFSNVNQIVQELQNIQHKEDALDLITAFDNLKLYQKCTEHKIIRQQARNQVYRMKEYMQNFKLVMAYIKQKKNNTLIAYQFKKSQDLLKLKIYYKKIRQVLHVERKWLLKVKNEFKMQKKERIWQKWMIYNKYMKTQKMVRHNVYYKVLGTLKGEVYQSEGKLMKSKQILQKSKLHKIFQAFKENTKTRIQYKQRKYISSNFRERSLNTLGLNYFLSNFKRMKEIKGDILLSKAYIQNNEFFTVSVCKHSNLSEAPRDPNKKRGVTITKLDSLNLKIV